MKKTCYLFRKHKYRKCATRFNLEDYVSEDSDNFNDEEFLYNFRLTRESFFILLEEMKTRKAFIDTRKYLKQHPVAYQLPFFVQGW
jgi:hypothetical protein